MHMLALAGAVPVAPSDALVAALLPPVTRSPALLMAVGLAVLGPGRWSLDHALGLDLAGIGWGAVALVGGLLAAGGMLATSYRPNATKASA